MQPRIETLPSKKLIGKRLSMSFANNQTFVLWQSFMPRRKEIVNTLTKDLYSLQIYPDYFDFSSTNLNTTFEKWAAVEVADFIHIPEGLEACELPAGLYAVFEYKGLSSDTKVYEYIFGVWLPGSTNYMLDNRPHFELLGEKYKNNDADSEEEIWIPIRRRE